MQLSGAISHTAVSARHLQGIRTLWDDIVHEIAVRAAAEMAEAEEFDDDDDDDDDN